MTVGRIVRAHGARGRVVVKVESDNPDRFVPPARFLTRNRKVPQLTLRDVAERPDGILAEFAGIVTRAQALELVGSDLIIRVEDRRELGADEFWPDQLIGLEVRVGASEVGIVKDVITGTQDRLLISEPGGGSVEVPFVAQLVPEVDLAQGWLRINPPDGLL